MPKQIMVTLDFGNATRIINLPNAVTDQEPATLAQLKAYIDGLKTKIPSVDALQPAGSASFVYEGGALTQMTEQLPAGGRVTAYSYTDGRLTSAVETFEQLVRTTAYTYQAGILTGFTTTEGGV